MPVKKETSGFLEGVNPKIFGLLGITDNKDIDLGTYKTLLKEKMVAGRMTDSGLSSGETEALTDEWKRVKSIKEEPQQAQAIPQTPKVPSTKTPSGSKMGKDSVKAPPGTKIDPQKLLPPSAVGSDTDAKADNVSALSSGLVKVEDNLKGILVAIEKGNKIEKDAISKDRVSVQKATKADRESKLESRPQANIGKKILDKVAAPAKGIFEMIWNFVKNIMLGTAVIGLLKLIQNPWRILDPLKLIINGIIDVLNFALVGLGNQLIRPFNAIIDGINWGIEGLIGGINKAISIIPGVGEDTIPVFKIPNIPDIPDIPKLKYADDNIQTSAEGGMVWRESTSKSGDGTTDADQLGTHSIRQVTPDEAHQRYAQHGLPSMELEDGKVVPDVGKMSADKITTSLQMIREDVDKGSHSQKKEMIDQLDWLINNPHGQPEAIQNTINRLVPGSEAQVYGDLGDDITVAATMKGGGEVPAQKMSVKKGGKITSGSGVKVKGAGKDTQLVAAQPGEIVMSKKAVDKIGADKLLAMNKEGGGDNKPRFINSGSIQKAEGGGTVTQTIMAMQGGGGVGISPVAERSIPGPRPSGGNIIMAGGGGSTPPPAGGGGPASANQKVVPVFSASDINNSMTTVVKALYNLVGEQ